MKNLLDKISGYGTLCSVSRILTGECFSAFSTEEELTASDLVHFKYAPTVSADVERSFSKYKNVLSDKERIASIHMVEKKKENPRARNQRDFTRRPLYPRGKSPWYSLDRRLDGPPESVWTKWRRENSRPSAVQPVASRHTDYTSTLADPCGCNQTNSNKRRAYSALLCRQNNRHMSLQQQQLQRQQHVYQLQRRNSNSGDLQQPLPIQLLPNKGQHESAMNQAHQQFRRHNSGDSGDQSITPKERRLHGQPVESCLDVMASNSYPMYVHRPRGSSNSSQTTTTTSLGKLSLNGGNNCRSDSALAANIQEPPSHVSTESAKSTISDSSLQDLDETEFVGSELARYMGELNQQKLVR
ncbi:hypothetical protein B7P43_G02195 [Cryptotermes secundus]|uniref:Uncharacterized protein n=1 Tax=Cryptotermes secundus TaxID=105785 RepID=A0A2J7PNL0_9NEOP|nr:hypothetical protein B7P43_G02195 [Cryptotermes secundus]